jgi:flagellin-specific chaperone FliS
LRFNDLAIVFDDSIFYQRRIVELCPVEGKPYAWWKSNLFTEELQELFRVNEQIREIRNAWYQRSIKDVGSTRKRLEELYEELEKIREPIRRKVLQYHYSKKGKPKEPSKYSPALVTANGKVIKFKPPNLPKVEPRDFSPPLLTPFDSLTIKDNQYNIRTYLAPLLYRAALKQLKLAKEAYEKRSLQHSSVVIPDEIEASAVCIICSHACLDAYINEIIDDHFPEYSDQLRRMPLMQKWLIVPFILSSKACFNPKNHLSKTFYDLTLGATTPYTLKVNGQT